MGIEIRGNYVPTGLTAAGHPPPEGQNLGTAAGHPPPEDKVGVIMSRESMPKSRFEIPIHRMPAIGIQRPVGSMQLSSGASAISSGGVFMEWFLGGGSYEPGVGNNLSFFEFVGQRIKNFFKK